MFNNSNLNTSNLNENKKYYFISKIGGHLIIMNQNCDFFFIIFLLKIQLL